MGLIFNAWGPAGTLTGLDDFATFLGNGVQQSTSTVSDAVVGDRAQLVTEDGEPALLLTRYAGDAEIFGARTEVRPNDISEIADWVGEGVSGADANQAVRQYRFAFKFPSQSLPELSTGANWIIAAQLHQSPDTSPADTFSLNPALGVQLKGDGYGRLRLALLRQNDANATPASNKSLDEIASWRYDPDEWNDIHVVVTWSYSSAGQMTVYRHRRPIYVGADVANCPNNSPARGGDGCYPKIGPYFSAGDITLKCFYRGLIIGDHEATFADMYPELDDAVPLERVSGPVASGAL